MDGFIQHLYQQTGTSAAGDTTPPKITETDKGLTDMLVNQPDIEAEDKGEKQCSTDRTSWSQATSGKGLRVRKIREDVEREDLCNDFAIRTKRENF